MKGLLICDTDFRRLLIWQFPLPTGSVFNLLYNLDDHKTDDILRQIVDMNNKKNEDLWAIMNEKEKGT